MDSDPEAFLCVRSMKSDDGGEMKLTFPFVIHLLSDEEFYLSNIYLSACQDIVTFGCVDSVRLHKQLELIM